MVNEDVGRTAEVKFKAGDNLFRDHRAADDMPPLDHQHPLSRLRQITGANEPVVPPTNDNCVVICHETLFKSVSCDERSAVASRFGMTRLPGCAPF